RQIVAANAAALTTLLAQVRGDLDAMLTALASGDESTVERLLKAGVAGTEAIPGKHGGPSMDLVALTVAVPDRPGALAHLFAVADQAGVNIEDMRIDHDPARAYGLVELDVSESAAEALLAVLHAQGWVAHR
ncbi:MAG: prephenate dehydrogenase, partial [Nocardioidaceae bacterium]